MARVLPVRALRRDEGDVHVSAMHPDKSIDYYAYVGDPSFSVLFTKPQDDGSGHYTNTLTWKGSAGFHQGYNYISTRDVSGNNNGEWRFDVQQSIGGQTVELVQAQWFIDPVTGTMETLETHKDSKSKDPVGDFYDMLDTPSQVGSDWAVSYGFYDSGSGKGTLTDHDQNYVYVTPAMADWMAEVTKGNAQLAAAPFNAFVLPGAHDAGTYDLAAVTEAFQNPGVAKSIDQLIHQLLIPLFGGSAVSTIVNAVLKLDKPAIKLVQDLAVTQKDSVSRMLDLGVRYFDFRPGYCVSEMGIGPSNATIFHQHAVIPGVGYQVFLTDVFKWLTAHPGEIVVVSANFQGFDAGEAQAMQPSVQTLETIAADARTAAGATAIVTGGLSDLTLSYSDLIKAGKRLIFLNQIDPTGAHGTNNTRKYDSYSLAYRTTDVGHILSALNGMSSSGQTGFDYTVMQLQGTAQGTSDNVEGAITDFSWSGSPLMSTKAAFDSQTYPWLLENLRANLGHRQLTVLLNDFADNALAQTAKTILAKYPN